MTKHEKALRLIKKETGFLALSPSERVSRKFKRIHDIAEEALDESLEEGSPRDTGRDGQQD